MMTIVTTTIKASKEIMMMRDGRNNIELEGNLNSRVLNYPIQNNQINELNEKNQFISNYDKKVNKDNSINITSTKRLVFDMSELAIIKQSKKNEHEVNNLQHENSENLKNNRIELSNYEINNKLHPVNNQKIASNLSNKIPVTIKEIPMNSANSKDEGLNYKMSSCEILLSAIFCCNKRLKKKADLIEKGEEKVFFYMDVLTYIKRMQEIDILKYIILSKNQLNLFDFLSRPSIATADFENEISKRLEEEQNNFDSLSISFDENNDEKKYTHTKTKWTNLG